MEDFKAIIVWRWKDAPNELKALSDHGGDEDWVALIPPHMANDWIPWMESGTSFGCCEVTTHEHPTLKDWCIRIGAHS